MQENMCMYYFVDADAQSDTGKWIDKHLKGIWVSTGFTNLRSQGGEESVSILLMNSMRIDGRYDPENELMMGSVDEVTGMQRIWDDISGQELDQGMVKRARAE